MIRASKGAQRLGRDELFETRAANFFPTPRFFLSARTRAGWTISRARIADTEEGGGVGNNADARLMIRARAETVTRRCFSPRDPPTQLGFFFVQSTEFRHPVGIKLPPSFSSCSGSRD